jgi:hypothetical protein
MKTFGSTAKSGNTLEGPLKSVVGGSPCGMDNAGNVYISGSGGIRVARKAVGNE